LVTRRRTAVGIPAQTRAIRDGKVAVPEERPLTPRRAVGQVVQRPETRAAATDKRRATLRPAHPDLDAAIRLTEGFATLIRTRDPASLDRWLDPAAASSLRPCRSFAARLRRDYDAGRAGVELNGSTGPVEGPLNRLKLVKRTMFGRAGFALLQRRMLLTG